MKFSNRKPMQTRPRSANAFFSYFAALLFTQLYALSYSQGYIEGANISYEYIPMEIETPYGNQKFTVNNFKIGTTIPIFLKPDKSQYLLVGANLEAFDFSGAHPDFEVESVYSISPTLGYSTMITKNFNLTALLMPALNSDYKAVSGSDINLGGVVRGSWKTSENLTWRVLLGYRQQFYGPQYIVLLGIDWKVNDRWRIFGDVPSSATVSYAVNQKVNAGFNLFVQPSTYRLRNQERYFEYNAVNPGLFAEYYIASQWAVRATAAYSITRDMEIYNKNDKTDGFIDFYEMSERNKPINPEVTSGLSFKIGLSYRIVPTKK